ncbi:hypothetical protein BN136_4245 [Cronobacter universalis NCTC 9529]|nr:hypothetical protein BN136_4245 [Cronobacter universalis NCTC 9529]
MGEGRTVTHTQKDTDREGQACQNRVDYVQDRRHEHEGELDRLGDTGQERGQRSGDHDTAHFSAVLRFSGVPDSDGSSRQTVHFEQEAAREFARGRVARHVTRDIAVEHLTCRVGVFADLHLERNVPDMVQTKRHQAAFDEAVDTKRHNRVLISRPLREGLNSGTNRRPNEGQDHASEDRRQTRDDRHETFTSEEAQILRKLNAVETVEHVGCNRTRNDPAKHTGIRQVFRRDFFRGKMQNQRRNDRHGFHHDAVSHYRRQGRHAVVIGEAQRNTDSEDKRHVGEN